MQELVTTATVDEQGDLDLHLHTDLPPGKHRVRLVIEDGEATAPTRQQFEFPILSVGEVLPGFSLHREDFYDEFEPEIKP